MKSKSMLRRPRIPHYGMGDRPSVSSHKTSLHRKIYSPYDCDLKLRETLWSLYSSNFKYINDRLSKEPRVEFRMVGRPSMDIANLSGRARYLGKALLAALLAITRRRNPVERLIQQLGDPRLVLFRRREGMLDSAVIAPHNWLRHLAVRPLHNELNRL